MNSNSNAVASVETPAPAPIVAAEKLAPVVKSGTPGITVNDQLWEKYCSLVEAGKPTNRMLPAALSELTLTDAQVEQLRAARATHRLNAISNKNSILAALRRKDIDIIRHRSNNDNTRGSVGWAHKRVITDKDGNYRSAFLFGKTPKAAK